jgi:hypothetical protein
MGDKITTHGYSILTSVEHTTIMIVELVVISGLGSSLEYRVWFGNGMVGYGLVQRCGTVCPLWIKLCDHFVPFCAFVIILCDKLKFNLMGSFNLQL